MRNKQGFTLIEILVVILIIGITASFTFFAFGDFGASRKITVAAEQFASYIKLVQQRALLEMTTLGISVNNNGYETFRLGPNLNWQPMPKNSLIYRRNFPKDTVLVIQKSLKNDNKTPTIIITPAGKISPFTLTFGTSSNPTLLTLIGHNNGELTWGKK